MGISHEDKSNKIEMLRKIEGELTYMCEKREYLAAKPKGTLMGNGQLLDLHALESKVDRDRKETKRNLKLEKDRAIQREKEEKNEAKKLKQQNLVIFKGHPEMKRARKKDLKPKQKNDDKPSAEIMDQMRYLGFKAFEQLPPSSGAGARPHTTM